jgi:hypothetical protein
MSNSVAARIKSLWKWLTTNKYVLGLEAELTRLRAENRALMNSILGIAGIPPIITDASANSPTAGATTQVTGTADARTQNVGQSAAPVRKRSWQQVNRALEFESAKNKEPGPGGVS